MIAAPPARPLVLMQPPIHSSASHTDRVPPAARSLAWFGTSAPSLPPSLARLVWGYVRWEQLRRARFENGQLEMHRLALQDELKANQEKLRVIMRETDAPESSMFLVPKLELEVRGERGARGGWERGEGGGARGGYCCRRRRLLLYLSLRTADHSLPPPDSF